MATKQAPVDVAFDQNFKSKKRLIQTNDFQLSVIKAALQALDENIDTEGRSVFDSGQRVLTPAQVYELEMLRGMVNDTCGSSTPEDVLHGFIL